ncbi:cadherin-like beta sandwich domain-containing protein [Paenibacillus elgii]|uniref:GAP1-N2 domain-containing protein n=1 Tax=Paenibacillus elgii TaxID=189691 RepID=UPI000FD7A085|nr:cadherin-like beta sandwich domain-containing protein [Paenibacillus elgii]NEN83830.1 cadherin-like beta sandwich domain-containing protein [Paenibacillus elgii]
MSRDRNIQQHYFTRDREGIFRTNEGFDTVAKSAGLDNGFIKAALHPYCVYKAPQELLARGEADEGRYPEAFGVFHADSGELVIGRTVYVSADFTGQRSAFFTHHYVVPKERQEAFVREPERLFALRGFRSSYDIQDGKTIPELDELDYGAAAKPENPDRLLGRLKLDRTRFLQLLYAVMASLTNKKKVYVALDADVSAGSEEAKRLMELVYRCLPYAMRRQLGFVTYQSEPEGKQHYHVMFVEKGSIRLPDRQLEKDYLFDLPNERVHGVDASGTEHSVLDYVWEHRGDRDGLERLYDFCEEALLDVGHPAALAVPTYSQLSELFRIEQGQDSLYEQNRAGTVKSILQYLTAETAGRKKRLNDMLVKLIRKELMDGDSVPTAEFVIPLLEYYAFADEGTKKLLIASFALYIRRAASAASGDIRAAVPLIDPLRQQNAVFLSVLKQLHEQHPQTAEQYAAYRITASGSIKEFLEEIKFWLVSADDLLLQHFFRNEVLKKVKQLLKAEKSRRMEVAKNTYIYFDRLPEREGKPQFEDFCMQIKLEIQLELLEDLTPAGLSYEDLMQLEFMLDPPQPELLHNLNSGGRMTLDLLTAVYRVLTLERRKPTDIVATIERLGPLDLERAQELLKKTLGDKVGPETFGKIAYAFSRPDAGVRGGGGYEAGYDFDRMLEYVAAQTRGTDTIYEFMLWSAGDSRFSGGSGIDVHYRAALTRYFDRHDSKAFKNKPIKEMLLGVPNEAFAAVFKEIKLKQDPGIVQFVLRRKRKLFRLGLLVLPLLLIIILLSTFWTPMMGSILRPTPTLTVETLPEKTAQPVVTVKASATDGGYDPSPSIFINGQQVGTGQVSAPVVLMIGENTIEIKAENKYGKASEPIVKKVKLDLPMQGPPLPASGASKAGGGTPSGGASGDQAPSDPVAGPKFTPANGKGKPDQQANPGAR